MPQPSQRLLDRASCLLLDMNSTFLFGEDRFGPDQDYAATCRRLGGRLPSERVRSVIEACYDHLDRLYPDPAYHDAFPTLAETLRELPEAAELDDAERLVIERTFAVHELGQVPPEYAAAVRQLSESHRLALVADIWSAKPPWLDELARVDLLDAFEVLVFSSDLGSVKPSPRPFRVAVEALGVDPSECLVIGDSARRDVGGARAAGLDAIWIGRGAAPEGAVGVIGDLLDLVSMRSASHIVAPSDKPGCCPRLRSKSGPGGVLTECGGHHPGPEQVD